MTLFKIASTTSEGLGNGVPIVQKYSLGTFTFIVAHRR